MVGGRGERDQAYRPFVSILIPALDEARVIRKTVEAFVRQDYPRFEVIVIDDGSTDQTPHVLWLLQQQYPELRVLRRELTDERGKPAALNDALKIAKGEVIAVFDSDTRVDRDFIRTVVPYLKGRKVAGVQTMVRMYNKNTNLWTMVQDTEFAIYCSVIQAGRDRMRGYCGLGGNGQFVKRRMLEAVGGWRTGTLAEDFDLSLELMEAGYRIRYVGATVEQEAVVGFGRLWRQRTRWSQGGLQTTLHHFKRVLLSRNIKWWTKLDTLYVFSTTVQPPIMLASFLLTGFTVWHRLQHWTGFHMHWANLPMLLAYILFITVGFLKGNPRSWLWVWFQVPAYYVYSLMWPFLYIWSASMYFAKRGKGIAWAKTEHLGDSNTSISA